MFLQALYRDVLEGSCVGEARDQAKPRFSYPRSYAVDGGELQQRRVDRPLGDELLNLIQDRRALLVVVERTLSWFGRNRRLAKDFENLAETLATFVTLASIQLALRRLARA